MSSLLIFDSSAETRNQNWKKKSELPAVRGNREEELPFLLNVSPIPFIIRVWLEIIFKSDLCYKMIASQNVPSEAQVKNFFVS